MCSVFFLGSGCILNAWLEYTSCSFTLQWFHITICHPCSHTVSGSKAKATFRKWSGEPWPRFQAQKRYELPCAEKRWVSDTPSWERRNMNEIDTDWHKSQRLVMTNCRMMRPMPMPCVIFVVGLPLGTQDLLEFCDWIWPCIYIRYGLANILSKYDLFPKYRKIKKNTLFFNIQYNPSRFKSYTREVSIEGGRGHTHVNLHQK